MSSPCSTGGAVSLWTWREIVVAICLFVGTALTLSFRLGQTSPTVAAEIRCWKTVSEMTQTGEWLVPHRGGNPALNKPPLFYWAGSAVSALAGGASYATLRAPSVIAALGLLVLTFAWGRSIGGPALGLLSAGVTAVMFKFYDLGREGTFEMMLALFTNAALLTFDRMYWLGRRSLAPLLCLMVVAAFLTKGPPTFLIVGAPIVLFLLFRGEIRRALAWPVASWAAVTLLLSLVWFAVVLYRVPGAWDWFFSEAVLPMGVESTHDTAKHYHDFFYFFSRFVVITPFASLLLPLVVWRGWQTRFWRDDPRLRFCAWIAVGLLVAFSCFPQKQQHYLLPLFPAIIILTADAALWAANAQSKAHWAWLGLPSAALGIAIVISVIPLVFYFHVMLQVGLASVIVLCAIVALFGSLIVWFAAKRRWLETGGAIILATWLLFSIHFGNCLILRSQFETGEIEQRADYDEAHWTRLKKDYPFVGKIFHRGSRFIKDEKKRK